MRAYTDREADRWIEILAGHDRANEDALLGAFISLGRPSSILDLGCGTGAMVNIARRIGIDAWGVDLIPHPEHEYFVLHDLEKELDLGRHFDWVISLEVAEHLSDLGSISFLHSIYRNLSPGGLLLFSAAPPGQEGEGHINLHPAIYWRTRLYDLGIRYQEEMGQHLSLIWSASRIPMFWLAANLQVFLKDE